MKQSIKNKIGEITFRKKLTKQQVEGETFFDDEFNSDEIESIINQRMGTTLTKIKDLIDSGAIINPYLEIGAERGQRSLVMENDFNSTGAAIDLSLDMLKSCKYYGKKFNKKNTPLRICTDAYNLPFKSNSVPFIFCFQTLHHFPDPTPIISEVYRVLSDGGVFLFDEEPYKKVLHLSLYKKREKIYSKKEMGKNIFKKISDYFFAEKVCNETEFGIIENDDISLRVYKNALTIFYEKNIHLLSLKFIKSNLFSPSNYLSFLFAFLFGGRIYGTCRKSGKYPNNFKSIKNLIICPSCKEKNQEQILEEKKNYYFCSNCNNKFPIVDDVLILLNGDLFSQLYPEQYSIKNNG
jgi:ubiquinone/menaquinone biosynthesis C-methylase UbiE/uncharacterized protein YbaR (Trm112 family)